MKKDFLALPRTYIDIDAGAVQGPFDGWRHSLGHGAVNSEPLPERVVEGVKKLKPRLIRIFLQEYFNVYPDQGVFDWTRLDAYMDSFAQTGAKVIATINFKPPVLFPEINHGIWRPNHVEEWQNVIYQLVKRYSVDKPIVTHWEHANEPDIGETGGCPFLMPTPEENHEFYAMLIKPILEAWPEARVGGPAMAYCYSPIFKGFIELCHKNGTPLHFVSWHSYHNDPKYFTDQVDYVGRILGSLYGEAERPEMFYDEINKGFDFQDMNNPSYYFISVEELAQSANRAAFLATTLLSLMETGVDRSNHFLIWDCCMHPREFKSFFSDEGARGVMYKHWNETPSRHGLFSQSGRVRPQYFVYQMLSRMGENKVSTRCEEELLKTQAAAGEGKVSVLMSNYSLKGDKDLIVTVRYTNLKPGPKKLTIFRIDDDQHWDSDALELMPVDQRMVDVMSEFEYQCYCPSDSVVMMTLEAISPA